jgi:hypothetical protein
MRKHRIHAAGFLRRPLAKYILAYKVKNGIIIILNICIIITIWDYVP